MQEISVDNTVYDSIMRTDVDIRSDLYANILISGGNTLFKGLDDRLAKEITILAPSTMTIKIIAPLDREHAAWLGGSFIASLYAFPELVINKQEYDNYGPGIVMQKCF